MPRRSPQPIVRSEANGGIVCLSGNTKWVEIAKELLPAKCLGLPAAQRPGCGR